MKKVHFHTISIKNFLSVGETPIEIKFQKGLNLITGNNTDNQTRNGVGKSSIIEAIFWCLFGNTIRDIKNDKIIHNHSKKGCEVQLNFDVIDSNNTTENFTIKRYLGPSKIEVWNGDKNITQSTIPANDEYIKNLIGATEELFNNSVIMTANNTLPFMAQKKIDKRKFIESVLNLSIFTNMLLKTRSDYNDTKKENDIACNTFINLQRNIETFEQQKQNETKKKKEKIDNWNWNIQNNLKLIDDCKNKKFPDVLEIEKEIDELENNKLITLKQSLKKANEKKNEISSKKYTLVAEIKQFKKEKQNILDKGNVCPTCNREYCKEDIQLVNEKLNHLDNIIKEYETNLLEISDKNAEYDNKIKTIEEGIDKINLKIKNLNKLKSSIKDNDHLISKYNHEIKQFEQFIKEIDQEKSVADENIENSQKQLEVTKKELKTIKQKLAILDDVKFVLSEEGVKTYIIKKLLDLLNNKLNFYLKRLDAPCSCTFNEQFEETILNLNGKECSYFNFSGGERKRIDISILFMFQDVLRFYSGTSYSLNMYDELFDSAIDEAGTDKIIEILKERVENYNESVYIVSHNKSSLKNTFDDVILLEKTKGKTLLVS